MPDLNSPSATNGAGTYRHVSYFLYRALISLQQQSPDCLNVRYRSIPWHQARYRSALLGKLTQSLSQLEDQGLVFSQIKKYLRTLLSPEFQATPAYESLINDLEQLVTSVVTPAIVTPETNPPEINPQVTPPNINGLSPTPASSDTLGSLYLNGHSTQEQGVSILLLDAENLQLNSTAEAALAEMCHYPLQIKIAFANWHSLGRRDNELHQRGYQLIHVPSGKDSADLNMAAVGSSLFVHYPTAKEVLVCSCDRALTHLCNRLQSYGLTVYQVRKRQDQIIVFNSKTGKTEQFLIVPEVEVPSVETLVTQTQKLIQMEQRRTKSQWIKFSRLSMLYKETYGLTLNQAIATHFSGAQARDFFIRNSCYFVLHQPSAKSPTYIATFSLQSRRSVGVSSGSAQTASSSLNCISHAPIEPINSPSELERILVELMQELTKNLETPQIPLSILGSHFNKKYGVALIPIIKQFRLGGKLTNFIDWCSQLNLEKTETGWNVYLLG
ncbi:MAG: NYN domain-containing protein [Microcoleaceae cyanobacterium]